jgi:hypothetical protein
MDIELLAKKMREKALADSKTIVLREEVWPEEAKAIYYHAGRYAQGARDSKARESYFRFVEAEK